MMKKIILAALSSAALIAGAGSANAATATATSGMTFTVGAACTVTAGVVDLGAYTVGDTVQTFTNRQGVAGATSITVGSDAAKQLASVTCPSGTAWTLKIAGTAASGAVDVKDPSNASAFQTFAYSDTVAGVATAGFVNGNTTARFATGTGSGSAQLITGRFVANNPSATVLATALATGTYSGAATATLTY